MFLSDSDAYYVVDKFDWYTYKVEHVSGELLTFIDMTWFSELPLYFYTCTSECKQTLDSLFSKI